MVRVEVTMSARKSGRKPSNRKSSGRKGPNRKSIPLRTSASKAARKPPTAAEPKGGVEATPRLIGGLQLARHHRSVAIRSAERGRSESFRVDVDPDGTTTITPIGEETDGPKDGAVDPLAAARERGRLLVADIMARRDMKSADEFASLLGTTRMTVNTKRRNGEILGLQGATRGFRFPAWQIGRDGRPYPELKRLHELLGDPWAVYRFMTSPEPGLRHLTGRQALAQGKGRWVLEIAEGIAQGAFG